MGEIWIQKSRCSNESTYIRNYVIPHGGVVVEFVTGSEVELGRADGVVTTPGIFDEISVGMSVGSTHVVPFTPGDDVVDIIDIITVVVALDSTPSPVVVIDTFRTEILTGRAVFPGLGMFEHL